MAGMYTLSDFDFNLPKELIAQAPLEQRSASRLLVVWQIAISTNCWISWM